MGKRRDDSYTGRSSTTSIPFTDIDDTMDAQWRAEDARNRATALTGGFKTESLYDPGMYAGVEASETVGAPPSAIAAQRDALAQMAQNARGAGGAQEAAQMRAMQGAVGRQQSGAAMQSAAQGQASGMGGMGNRMTALRGLYDATGQMGASAEDEAKRRGLSAAKQRGQLASSMRRQSFGEARHRAGASNDRAEYNMGQRRGVVGRNTDRRNRVAEQVAGQYVGSAGAADSADARLKQSQQDAEDGLLQLVAMS